MEHFFDSHHVALRDEVRRFAERVVRPHVARMEERRGVEHGLSREIAARGWIGVTIPRRYGGLGLGHVAKTIVIEELARVSGAMGAMTQASQLGVAKVLHFGTARQKERWLPRFATGDALPTIGVTEPASGGHVLGMRSSAVRDGDDYVLNGRKCFVGNSHIGDIHGVVARTGPGSRGLSAVALGIHQAILEDTLRFCLERELYGEPLAELPTVSLKLGELQSRLMTARLAAYYAVHLRDRGESCDAELMNAKLLNTESALTSARTALEIFAGHGCQREHNIERYLRDVIHTFPAAGTSDVQRLRLAQVALGEYPTGWSEHLSDACQSFVDPSGPIVVDGLCATSQAWPSGSTNTPE
jgi:alkylation response protein AidB-like acyl-CoA dehydrogenase